MATTIFRQGDTTNFAIGTSRPLGNKKLKIGLFKKNKAVYEAVYPDDGVIIRIDDTNFMLKLEHETTMEFTGPLTLRATIYTPDLSMVNSGENQMQLQFEPEPVNYNLE